jgi:hypothetical protein
LTTRKTREGRRERERERERGRGREQEGTEMLRLEREILFDDSRDAARSLAA